MLGSMYSGVSGMKVHQTRLNVIGNNIANVNTYGFKASRATFRDVYYQTLSGGNSGSSTTGGSNPSQVGYGAKLGSVDLLMNRTSFQMTDRSMDLAVDGEGFFQVQDAAGNRFYTRAGQLLFDSAGNLVDSQGNFVLGISGNPLGKAASSNLIQLQIPPVPPTPSSASEILNNVNFNIAASNDTKDGNVSFSFSPDASLARQELVKAQVGTNGISIAVNPNATFADMNAFSKAVNDAITDYTMEQTGKPHPAGDFTITCDPVTAFPAGGLTGSQICSNDFGTQYGTISGWPRDKIFSGIAPTGISGTDFGKDFNPAPPVQGSGAPSMTYTAAVTTTTPPTPAKWTLSMTMGGQTYTADILDDAAGKNAGKIFLKNSSATASDKDYIEMKCPSFSSMVSQWNGENPNGTLASNATLGLPASLPATAWTTDLSISKTTPSVNLGLSDKKFLLKGGTAGGAQGIENLTGIVVGSDGVITAQHALLGDITVGRIDLVTFGNPEGLRASGGTYFTASANSGKMSLAQAGQDGSGPLVAGSLEMSNVDLSREFSDMITTQRGFQANTRIITVSDEVLNELVNLKR